MHVATSRRNIFNTIVRSVFALIFAGGCIAHLILGRVNPEGYAAFGSTAVGPLNDFWQSWVMPNIGVLTIVMGLIELAIAIGLFKGKKANQIAALVACLFFVFLLFLGYGMPQDSLKDDFVVNRLFTVIMLIVMIPNLIHSLQFSLPKEWKMIFKR